MTLVDQRFNLCQLDKIKGLISGWIDYVKKRSNTVLKCPFKAGRYIFRCNDEGANQNVVKEMSPAFVRKNADTMVNDTWTFLTRFKTGFVPMFVIENQIKLAMFT